MAQTKPPLDLSVAITTPENVRFEYRVAGPFRRTGAMLVDVLLRGTIFAALLILLLFSGIISRIPAIQSFGLAMLMVGSFLLTWFYGATCESTFNGQTPGKMLFGLRVISVDGRPINAVQATLRNLIRVADTMPLVSVEAIGIGTPMYGIPTFIVGLLCMIMTQRMQRLGDLAAGTMVVLDEKYWYPRHARLDDPRIGALAEYIPASFHMSSTMARTVALFIDRRPMLSPARREDLARILAEPLIRRFDFRPDTSGDLLLCALYYRDFIASDAKQESSVVFRGASPMNAASPTPLPSNRSPLASPEASIELNPVPMTESTSENSGTTS